MLIMASMVSAATVSLNAFTVLAERATLEEILAEIEALNAKLDNIEANITALKSALNSLEQENQVG